MYVLPLYDVLILPGVNIYVKISEFEEFALQPPNFDGECVMITAQTHKPRYAYKPEDFYEIGVHGVITDISDEGFVTIRSDARVLVNDIEVLDDGTIHLDYRRLVDVDDVPEEERVARLNHMKEVLLSFTKQFDWAAKVEPMIDGFDTIEEAGVSLSPYLTARNEDRYHILTYDSRRGRMEAMEQIIFEFIEMAKASAEAMESQQWEYDQSMKEQALRRQIDVLQRELDAMHPENSSDLDGFAKKIDELALNDLAKNEARKVLRRLRQENNGGNEYALLYDYMEYLLSMPWSKQEAKAVDVAKAEAILDEDHYGLKKVKSRVIQQLAVMALKKRQAGSILLFVGAPGTGKTSVGQSIARALDRECVRVSLGGVRDEADIRGHRRTYIGAMAGRIIDGIHKVGVSNPVMVLDEIDKLSASYNGDPASALLEVLDPEQNANFVDHYLNVPYDLSDVLFVCTANSTDGISAPLLNRMEVIDFSGYTLNDKLAIAKTHLLKKSLDNNGLQEGELVIPEETLRVLIDDYTMEAGVRGLRKRIDTLCRYAAVKTVKGEKTPFVIKPEDLHEWLDMQPLLHDRVLEKAYPGVVTGLAWTSYGGDILYIETLLTKGTGKLMMTGKLGEVMKESAYIALSLVKSLLPEKSDVLKEKDIHIHVPDGAVPKDGPSAGVALTTALASLVLEKGISPLVAMTGEVSLRGAVTAIGGLQEKLMAASRAGITTVLIPKENMRDLADIDEEIYAGIDIVPVESISEVLDFVKLSENDHA